MDWLDIKEFFKDSIKMIMFIVVVLVIVIYVVGLQQVVGESMNPNLKNEDIVILNKLKYRLFDIEYGDIVALYDKDSKYMVKRVIGLPGDSLYIKDNKLFINDKEVKEDYLDSNVLTEDFDLRDLGYEKIPDDMYFVLGDNRENSKDSRVLGLISKKDIKGKVVIRIFPFNNIKVFR